MRSYFVPTLTPRTLDWLKAQAFAYENTVLDRQRGVVLNTEALAQLCKHFRSFVSSKELSRLDGVTRVTLTQDPAQALRYALGNQRVAGWKSGRRNAAIRNAVMHELYPALGYAVQLHAPTGEHVEPIFDGRFHIWFWGTPYSSRGGRFDFEGVPGTLWGHDVLASGAAFSQTGIGIPIVDSDGFSVAELVEDNLFIVANFFSEKTGNEAAVFQRLLREVAQVLTLPSEAQEELVQNYFADRFAAECYDNLEQVVDNSQAGLHDALEAERLAEKAYLQAIRARVSIERALHEAETRASGSSEEKWASLRAGYVRMIARFKKVRAVYIQNGTMFVFTRTLYGRHWHTGSYHELGSYLIQIPMSLADEPGDEVGLLFFNLSRWPDVGGHIIQHPHVSANGVPCWGTTKQTFAQLLGREEYLQLVQYALMTLQEGINPDDAWGKRIDDYPIVPEGQERS